MATQANGAGPSGSPNVSASDMVKFVTAVLCQINNPAIVGKVAKDIASSMWGVGSAVDSGLELAGQTAAAAAAGKKEKGKKKTKENGNKPPRGLVPYTIFITKSMDWFGRHPDDPSLHVKQEDGSLPNKFKVASQAWASLSETAKDIFQTTYKPLCEQLHEESLRTGQKADHLIGKIQEFEKAMSPDIKQKLQSLGFKLSPADGSKVKVEVPPVEEVGEESENESVSGSESEGAEESSDEEPVQLPAPAPKAKAPEKMEEPAKQQQQQAKEADKKLPGSAKKDAAKQKQEKEDKQKEEKNKAKKEKKKKKKRKEQEAAAAAADAKKKKQKVEPALDSSSDDGSD